jgi:hypothetical protein
MFPSELKAKHGFTVGDLQSLFEASADKIRGWIDRDLLGKPMRQGGQVRFPERAVSRFIREHPGEFDLACVDQGLFRTLLFGPCPRRGDREGSVDV